MGYCYHADDDNSHAGDYDRYINERERQHEAALDAAEEEANLKAYRAEQGDDAPDPKPAPLYAGLETRIMYERDAALGDVARLEDMLETVIVERDSARHAQEQLRGELAAVTAERDELRKRVKVQSGTIYKLGKSWDFDREKLKDAEQRAALGDPAQFEAQALKSEIFGLEWVVSRFKTALEKIEAQALQVIQSIPKHELAPIVAQLGLMAHEALEPIPDTDAE